MNKTQAGFKMDMELMSHPVIQVELVDKELFMLVLERNGLVFDPGDCVALHTDNDKSRPYSIASGSSEHELRFLIREMEGGEVSPWLAQRKPGDTVKVSPPFGWFRPGQHADAGPSVFIATGTGLAPFLAYRETFPEQPPAALLFGVRQRSAAMGLEQLEDWCDTHLAISREAVPGHHHGHVTELLENLSLTPDTHYYLCGLESMINDCSAVLQQRGVDLFNIHREVFFHG